MNKFTEYLLTFVIGAVCLVLFVAVSLAFNAFKTEYHSVGPDARHLEKSDPRLFNLLYACKQHAVAARKIQSPKPEDGYMSHAIRLFATFQPDGRYVRLERNILKLRDSSLPLAQREKLQKVCRKDALFLDDPVSNFWNLRGPVLIIFRLLLQISPLAREGPAEPLTPQRRAELKGYLNRYLDGLCEQPGSESQR